MLTYPPCRDAAAAAAGFAELVTTPVPEPFCGAIRLLGRSFNSWSDTCHLPLPASGLVITPEIRRQSELYLPLTAVAPVFRRLYQSALTYPPIISSTQFHNALSWADVHAALPNRFQRSANPARLLAELLNDPAMLREFVCASFLPDRFYGGFNRYPQQRAWLLSWLDERAGRPLRCLNAACGTGEENYALALQLLKLGWLPERFFIEGWTLEPLEVWAAVHGRFPHDSFRETVFCRETAPVFEAGASQSLRFTAVDLLKELPDTARFDLILCNGLLGGPVINMIEDLRRVVAGLARVLVNGGVLLTADSFHEGWKRHCPQEQLRAVMEACGFVVCAAGEGLAGLKPDQ